MSIFYFECNDKLLNMRKEVEKRNTNKSKKKKIENYWAKNFLKF